MCCVYDYEKEYKVLLARRPDDKQLQAWARGVVLEDGHRAALAQVRFASTAGKGALIRVIMGEGRKRQIREIVFFAGIAGGAYLAGANWHIEAGQFETQAVEIFIFY